MKPIAIFRHAPHEGPGFLVDFLAQHQLPYLLIAIDAGDAVPNDVCAFSGLVFMGGPMSVNDDLPWIEPVLHLIRAAVTHDIPVLGHCLGGQLMSKALGGQVTRNAIKEIGWGKVTVAKQDSAALWFGDIHSFDAFHWHGETFSLPPQAELILSSQYCENQAYVLGKHLAMQCHVEMTESLIESWCETGADEIQENVDSPAVQSATEIQAAMSTKVPQLNFVAQRLYQRWISALK